MVGKVVETTLHNCHLITKGFKVVEKKVMRKNERKKNYLFLAESLNLLVVLDKLITKSNDCLLEVFFRFLPPHEQTPGVLLEDIVHIVRPVEHRVVQLDVLR